MDVEQRGQRQERERTRDENDPPSQGGYIPPLQLPLLHVESQQLAGLPRPLTLAIDVAP
jgi:hypothetical protein